MKHSARKQKGKKYENTIAEKLHIRLLEEHEEYKKLFESSGNSNIKPKRDFSSGNFAISDGDVDLGLAKKFFPISIECKHWQTLDLSLNSILRKKFNTLIKVWGEQALPQGKQMGLRPVIVFKANRTDNFCFYDKNEVQIIPTNRFIKVDDWIICLFDDFISLVIDRVKNGKPPFEKE